jgi:hypothetical protein
MRATLADGQLISIPNCYVHISTPDGGTDILMQSLPDISDGKSATYADESAIGRSTPFKTFSNSDNRAISWTAHYIVTKKSDIKLFFSYIRAIQSAVYPFDNRDGTTGGAPYAPPPICQIECGKLLSNSGPLNAIMKNYSIKFDTSVPWDEETLLPYKFDIDMTFDVIFNQSNLPGSKLIFTDTEI